MIETARRGKLWSTVWSLGCIVLAGAMPPPGAEAQAQSPVSPVPASTTSMAAHADASLARAVAYIKAQAAGNKGESLAAHMTPSGHWQLANAGGEIVTAAGADEVRRAIATLQSQAAAPAGPNPAPALVLTIEAAGRAVAGLGQLPAGSALSLLSEADPATAFRLQLMAASGAGGRLLAEVKPHLLLEVADPEAVREVLWQLDRALDPTTVRLLSLEPGGPRTLPVIPKRDAATRSPLPDTIDPYGLVKALPALKGQKVLVVGRLDKDLLWVQPRTGAEQSVLVKDLSEAAASNDIALVILDARLPRQPGERTWAYLKVGVPGFEEAMKGTSVAAFYNALAVAQGKLVLRVIERTGDRTRIEGIPFKTAWGRLAEERGFGGLLQDVVSGLTGNVAASAVQMNLRSRERQLELDRRWLPGIPSMLQITYAVLLAIGLAALPLARRWWARIWPSEERAEYASATGYWSARAIRALLFALVFVPVVAVVAFPAHVVIGLGQTLRMAVGAGRARRRRGAAGTASRDPASG